MLLCEPIPSVVALPRSRTNISIKIIADLKDKKGCDDLVAKVKKETDRLTVLVNNTGATWYVTQLLTVVSCILTLVAGVLLMVRSLEYVLL